METPKKQRRGAMTLKNSNRNKFFEQMREVNMEESLKKLLRRTNVRSEEPTTSNSPRSAAMKAMETNLPQRTPGSGPLTNVAALELNSPNSPRSVTSDPSSVNSPIHRTPSIIPSSTPQPLMKRTNEYIPLPPILPPIHRTPSIIPTNTPGPLMKRTNEYIPPPRSALKRATNKNKPKKSITFSNNTPNQNKNTRKSIYKKPNYVPNAENQNAQNLVRSRKSIHVNRRRIPYEAVSKLKFTPKLARIYAQIVDKSEMNNLRNTRRVLNTIKRKILARMNKGTISEAVAQKLWNIARKQFEA